VVAVAAAAAATSQPHFTISEVQNRVYTPKAKNFFFPPHNPFPCQYLRVVRQHWPLARSLDKDVHNPYCWGTFFEVLMEVMHSSSLRENTTS